MHGVVDAEPDEQHRESDRDQVQIAHRHGGKAGCHEDAEDEHDHRRQDEADRRKAEEG
jgi:hypothetical protein